MFYAALINICHYFYQYYLSFRDDSQLYYFYTVFLVKNNRKFFYQYNVKLFIVLAENCLIIKNIDFRCGVTALMPINYYY
jgi:hypothetical protein